MCVCVDNPHSQLKFIFNPIKMGTRIFRMAFHVIKGVKGRSCYKYMLIMLNPFKYVSDIVDR